jgi:hypothetical protein
VQLLQFSVYYSFQRVHAGNGMFSFVESDTGVAHLVDLPAGNYTFRAMCRAVQQQYSGVSMNYEGYHSGFSFTFEKSHKLIFHNDSFGILGFAAADVIEGEGFGSTTIVDLSPVNTLSISVDGMSPLDSFNLTNHQGVVRQTRVLANVPIQQTPYDFFTYMPTTDRQFQLFIAERELNELCFHITHANGEEVIDMPDWTIALRVDTVTLEDPKLTLADKTLAAVNRLVDLNRYKFVAKHLK